MRFNVFDFEIENVKPFEIENVKPSNFVFKNGES